MVSSTESGPSTADHPSGSTPDEATVLVGQRSREPDGPVETPTRVGRYMVLEQVGCGGMGRVLRAYDPKLRREVALKLLRADANESQGAPRIVREAQAMARLSHPNLVPVYDVEQDGDVVFIAMEYVEGDTLRTWLDESRRSWREVVAAFVGAGRGLAAAHAAGVIHRDFKPSNAMIGTDGRVRVMDFGLARGVDSNELHSAADVVPDGAAHSGVTELTQAGTIIGTPPYMAPEQHRGAHIVPASDQYAFCVALYEALFGLRPFAGTDVPALLAAKLCGVPRTPDNTAHGVPDWLHAAVVRGLAPLPADRWPTMDALLAAFERGQARARLRRVLVGLGALGLASAGVPLAIQLDVRTRTTACEQAGASIDEVWNADARTRLRDALVATGVGYAETTAAKVMPWFDAQAAAWQHARTEACLDADVRDEWDASTLDRSLWCLDERRMELEALVDELSRADATVVQRTVTAAAGLTSVDACRDAALLGRLPPPPADRREEVRAVRVELSRADALWRAGKYSDGLKLVRATRERAEALEWPPLSAALAAREASLLERQGAYEDAERVGIAAYFEAGDAGAWDVAAVVASKLVFIVGDRRARHAEGLVWGQHAELALAYAGDPEDLREASLLGHLAIVHYRAGDYAQARTLHERALAIQETALGSDHPDVAVSLDNLALVHRMTGEYAQAELLHSRALAIFENTLGPDHPDVAVSLVNLANVHQATGDYAQARTLHSRALAIFEEAFGADHPAVATSLINLANVYYSTGEYTEARARYERAIAIWENALGRDHPEIAAGLNNLAAVHQATGDWAQARTLHERALAIREKTFGPDHPHIGQSLSNLANVHAATGEYPKARSLYERALIIEEKALGPDHPEIALSLAGLANVLIASGDVDAAVRLLERALTIFERHDGRQEGELATCFALAKLLVAKGGDHVRARGLAEQARDGWRVTAEHNAKELAEVETWLTRPPR